MSRLLNFKLDFNIIQSCYDRIMQAVKEFIPDSTLCSNNYESRKIVSQLGLGYQKIDDCPNGCMIYYNKENKDKDKCQVCSHPRYKPMEQDTAQHMTWHHEYQRDLRVSSHPSDGEAWKHFNQTHPSFTTEPRNVRKTSFFDCHRQFLPRDHSFRRNKDGFIKGRDERDEPPPRLSEKNVFDNIFNTIMDDNDKTKDNGKARQDDKEYCKCRELELVSDVDGKVSKPKASFSFTKEQKQVVLQWVKKLKFPDGYASNLLRCADVHKGNMFGMKSHDFHVFIKRLLPIAFRERFPEPVWKAMTEILSPGFFDHIEHLVVHLSYEARVGGPVQYRWMYPFERYLYHLKKKVKNKARVESSICEAYVMEKISNFCSHYFEPHVLTNSKRVRRNDDSVNVNEREDVLSIFKHPVRPSGNSKRRYLNDDEYETTIFYVLHNFKEIQPFFRIFEGEVKLEMPNITNNQLVDVTKKRFGRWLPDNESDMQEVEIEEEDEEEESEDNNGNKKTKVFVDATAKANMVHGADDALDAQFGNGAKTFPKWIDRVESKNGTAYGVGDVDEYVCQPDIEEASTHNIPNVKIVQLVDPVKVQQVEHNLLKTEINNLKNAQEAQSKKLDQVVKAQSSSEMRLRKFVAQEVEKVVANEVGKAVAEEVGKTTQQILDAIPGVAMFVNYECLTKECTFNTIDGEAPHNGLTPGRPIPFNANPKDFEILTSFRGLVCVGISELYDIYTDLILWNPFAGEYKTLSRANSHRDCYKKVGKAFGLYYTSFDKDYKLVRVTDLGLVYIYSLKFDSWRKVDSIQHIPTNISERWRLNRRYLYQVDLKKKQHSKLRTHVGKGFPKEVRYIESFVSPNQYIN
uniref:DUF4218 domain-containing protein n=1 Tax=Tanacetum cinerariifolium TaxID=118510 RepID=A0A699HGV7_TANCI|nr:hypothetical protein [Tanacetum cinerariifolium]